MVAIFPFPFPVAVAVPVPALHELLLEAVVEHDQHPQRQDRKNDEDSEGIPGVEAFGDAVGFRERLLGANSVAGRSRRPERSPGIGTRIRLR